MMLKKIYQELVLIRQELLLARKELQAIRSSLEHFSKHEYIKCAVNAKKDNLSTVTYLG